MSVFWKRTFVYPEWFHSDCKVMPNWTNITFISQKWLQSHFKMTPKWPQSDLKVVPKWLQSELWHTKILRQNVFNLVMSRLGSDLDPIRSEFAFDPTWQTQNGSKTDPKWTQRGPNMHQNRTRIEPIGSEICFRSELTCSGWNDLGAADIRLGRQMGCQ